MGILAARRMKRTADQVSAALTDPASLPYASPWSDGELGRIAFEDFLHHAPPTGSREEAMRNPAIARARNLMVTLGSRVVLRPYRGSVQRPAEEVPFLYRTGSATSWQHRNVWTIDDLIFHGISCWTITRGSDRIPLTGDRVNFDRWTINPDNQVEVDGVPQDPDKVKLVYGFHEGILNFGRDVLTDARELRRIVSERIANPIPAIDLHQNGGKALTPEERRELVSAWTAARQAKNGASVAYSSETIEVRELGQGGAELLIGERNASAVDQARIVGIAASRIDATADKASLNYETTSGRNGELVDFDLALYLVPFAASLGTDDMVPAGTRIVPDYTELTSLQSAGTSSEVTD